MDYLLLVRPTFLTTPAEGPYNRLYGNTALKAHAIHPRDEKGAERSEGVDA